MRIHLQHATIARLAKAADAGASHAAALARKVATQAECATWNARYVIGRAVTPKDARDQQPQ